MKAEHFIENNYHSKAGLETDKLIEDKTGKEVSFEEIAEAYHEYKLKLLGITDVVVPKGTLCDEETEIIIDGCTCETGVCFLKHEH